MTISSFLDRLRNFFPGRRMEELESAMTSMKEEEMMAFMNELEQMEDMQDLSNDEQENQT